jgi:hypothetical protein
MIERWQGALPDGLGHPHARGRARSERPGWAWPARPAAAGLVLAAALAIVPAACSEPCCTLDGYPITLLFSDSGGLTARGQDASGALTVSVDTGSDLTFFTRSADERAQMVTRSLDLLDALPAPEGGGYPVRARLHDIEGLPVNLDPAGPSVILGAAFLTNFSVELDFGAPQMTLWSRLGTPDGYLTQAGFAVLHFGLFGGTELSAISEPDFLGLTGPVEVPPTRVVLRGCAGAKSFDATAALPELCCARGDEIVNATGVNLALSVSSGVGPLVLAESAWTRYAASQDVAPAAPAPGPDLEIPGLAAPLTGVLWATLSRLALVDPETAPATNPGACVELGRARRLDWAEAHRAQAACAQPCDTDPQASGAAFNAAAYVEIDRDLPVAIISDETPFLQAVRAEVRPAGPEVDGFLGADVFSDTTLELDYQSNPTRAIVSCAGGTSATCRVSPRCPRLESSSEEHACFGLAPMTLPSTCAPSGCDL